MSASSLPAGLLVVGGGPAGLAAARAYREHGGRGAVRLVSADTSAPYDRPPLSKDYLRGESEEDGLPLEQARFFGDRGVELLLGRTAVALDAAAGHVTLDDGTVARYDVCLLATGAEPNPLPVPGGDDPAVHTLRSLADARRLRGAAERAGRAVVVGSGFIGCEAAASLALRGVDVTLVSDEDAPQAARLGETAARRLAGWLTDAGVTLVLGDEVEAVERVGDAVSVRVAGRALPADLVLAALGVRPRSGLARDAGVAVERDRVRTDSSMRADLDGVLAAGDVALAHNPLAGRHLAVEHWGEALAMGAVAGATAAGAEASWAEAPGFWSEIGPHTLKYVAWGDGFDTVHPVEHNDGGFTVWYGRDGVTVGVLTSEADDDHERGRALVEAGAPLSPAARA